MVNCHRFSALAPDYSLLRYNGPVFLLKCTVNGAPDTFNGYLGTLRQILVSSIECDHESLFGPEFASTIAHFFAKSCTAKLDWDTSLDVLTNNLFWAAQND